MRLFDIFDSDGNKVGTIENIEKDGCFGWVVAIVLLLVLFGGGIASWYLLFTMDDFQPLILPVIISMTAIVGVSVLVVLKSLDHLISCGFILAVGIGAFVVAMCLLIPSATSSFGDFVANFILGGWFSMIPSAISWIVLKILKNK